MIQFINFEYKTDEKKKKMRATLCTPAKRNNKINAIEIKN